MSNITAKKKKSIQDYKSVLHAIAPLQLDRVVERLYDIENKQIAVHTQPLDEDSVAFLIQHYQGRRINAEVYGQLRRWQGTQTRVDADSRTHIPGDWLSYVVYLGGVLLITVFLLGCWQSFLLFSVGQSYLGVGVIACLAGAFALMHRTSVTDLFREKHYQAAKDVDYVMQQLADILTENDSDAAQLLEFDGTEDALTRLLNSQPHKLKIGSDGELE